MSDGAAIKRAYLFTPFHSSHCDSGCGEHTASRTVHNLLALHANNLNLIFSIPRVAPKSGNEKPAVFAEPKLPERTKCNQNLECSRLLGWVGNYLKQPTSAMMSGSHAGSGLLLQRLGLTSLRVEPPTNAQNVAQTYCTDLPKKE